MNPQLRNDLTIAIGGLLYPSETDAAFELVDLSPPYPWETKGPSEVIGPRQFFAQLLNGPTASPDAPRYKLLWELLACSLNDLQVHSVGEINIDLYLTGIERDPDLNSPAQKQNRVGVKTHAVET